MNKKEYIKCCNEKYTYLNSLYTEYRNIKNEIQFNEVCIKFNEPMYDSIHNRNNTEFVLYLLNKNELEIKDNKVIVTDFINFIKQLSEQN